MKVKTLIKALKKTNPEAIFNLESIIKGNLLAIGADIIQDVNEVCMFIFGLEEIKKEGKNAKTRRNKKSNSRKNTK